MIIVKPSVELLSITPFAETLLERAGRTCYKSECRITQESAGPFIHRILESQHESVIEHAVATFRFVCDRGVTHELVRHRLASFSQESTRYCSYGKEKFGNQITVIEPPGLTGIDRENWETACLSAERMYLALTANKVTPQIARSVLPTCLKTEIVVTANFREWRHILKLRTSQAAHPQIREIMDIAAQILVKEAPSVFGDLFQTKNKE